MNQKQINLYALAQLAGYVGPPEFCHESDCELLVEYYCPTTGLMNCKDHAGQLVGNPYTDDAIPLSVLNICSHEKHPDDTWDTCPFNEEINDDKSPCWCCDKCQEDCADEI